MSNLRLLNQTLVSASTSSVNVTDVFSADFDIYKITTNSFSTVGGNKTNLHMRFINSSGSVITTSNYDRAFLNMKSETTFGEGRSQNANLIENFFSNADQSPDFSSSVSYIFNPFSNLSYTYALNQSDEHASSVFRSKKYIAVLSEVNSITGFQLFENDTKPFDEGVIRTYGLRVDT